MEEKTRRAVPTTAELKRVLRFVDQMRDRNVLVTSLKFDGLELAMEDLELLSKVVGPTPTESEEKQPQNWRQAIDGFRKELNGG